jgi:hypothetical protein
MPPRRSAQNALMMRRLEAVMPTVTTRRHGVQVAAYEGDKRVGIRKHSKRGASTVSTVKVSVIINIRG